MDVRAACGVVGVISVARDAAEVIGTARATTRVVGVALDVAKVNRVDDKGVAEVQKV
jgi:hypothetical protein